MEYIAGEGKDGVSSCIAIGFEAEREKVMDEVVEDFCAGRRTLRLDDKHLEAEMVELNKMVCKSLRRGARRRAVSRWSLPSEIW